VKGGKMSIKIKQQNQKWVLELNEEVWEFDNKREMEYALRQLLDLKERKGNLNFFKESKCW